MNGWIPDEEAQPGAIRGRMRQRQDIGHGSARQGPTLPRRSRSIARRRTRSGQSVGGIHRRRRKRMTW